jgi:heat shock protein HtpX
MAIAKRIFLFIVINVLVVLTISIVLNLFGVKPYLSAHGIDYRSLLIFCLIWGMAGAFISLGLSRIMAKWMLGVQLVDPKTNDPQLRQLVAMIKKLSSEAHLPALPQIGIFSSKEVNAFATGPSRRRALVAVSTALLEKMDQQEVEGVLAHEISHIVNGDMVTMTLIQGIVNAFVMFLARALAFVFSGIGQKRQGAGGSYMSYFLFVLLFEVVFMLFGSMVIAGFSRYREFRADRGGAHLAGKEKMISALERLRSLQNFRDAKAEKSAIAALMISHPRKSGILSLFSSHPPLEKRIERLKVL